MHVVLDIVSQFSIDTGCMRCQKPLSNAICMAVDGVSVVLLASALLVVLTTIDPFVVIIVLVDSVVADDVDGGGDGGLPSSVSFSKKT